MPHVGRTWLVAVIVSAAAACNSATHQISDSGFGAYEVSAAAWPDGLVLAWYDTRDGNAEIYVRMLDGAGRPTGLEQRLTNTATESYEADVAAIADGFVVAWYEKTEAGDLRAQLGRWRRNGEQVWSRSIGAATRNSRNPVVRSFGDGVFCAWIELDELDRELVWGGWWNLDGSVRVQPTQLGPAGATTWNLNAVVDSDGRAFVVFDALVDTKAEELYLAELGVDETLLTRLSADDGHASKYPDVALGAGRAALTWFDERDGNREVYIATGSLAQLRSGTESRARRVTTTPGRSIGAYLAWNGERIGLAWSDDSDGAYEIYYQALDPVGAPLAPPSRLTTTASNSMIPAIRAWQDGFAIAWNEVEHDNAAGHDGGRRSEVVVSFAP